MSMINITAFEFTIDATYSVKEPNKSYIDFEVLDL